MNKMKALVFEKPGKIQLKEIPVPEVTQPDDVLIKVAACGVCGTDIKILEGKHVYAENTVLGHEFNGTVVAVGPTVTTLKVGDRVSVDNNIRCGVCSFCRLGLDSQCVAHRQGRPRRGRKRRLCRVLRRPRARLLYAPAEIDELATQVETLSPVLNGVRTVQINPGITRSSWASGRSSAIPSPPWPATSPLGWLSPRSTLLHQPGPIHGLCGL